MPEGGRVCSMPPHPGSDRCPDLVLTARTEEAALLEGLGLGADDYLYKPFRLAELRARVGAHLRRQNRVPTQRILRGGVGFDLMGKTARLGRCRCI